MLKLEAYYLAAMTSCERLTDEIINNSHAIMASVKLIEETFLRASKVVIAATDVGVAKEANQPVSLPAVMLEKEMLNLVFSLSELKSSVQLRLSSTLQHLNEILTDAAIVNPRIKDPAVRKSYEEYREVLICSIHILNNLSDELFDENI